MYRFLNTGRFTIVLKDTHSVFHLIKKDVVKFMTFVYND